MTIPPALAIGRLVLSLLLLSAWPFRLAAQTNRPAELQVPTGVYKSGAEISPSFIMRIAADGKYQVAIGCCGPLGPLSQEGTWQWDGRRYEFLLSSTEELWLNGSTRFEFRRFRLDQHEPGTLDWVPREGDANVLGVYKSIKFRLQPDAGVDVSRR